MEHKDLRLVEQLGSGIPRILDSYNKECFTFSDNFLRMTFPFINHLKGGPIGGPVGGPIDKKIEDLKDLSDRQKIILDLIKKDPRVSKSKNSMKIKINEVNLHG